MRDDLEDMPEEVLVKTWEADEILPKSKCHIIKLKTGLKELKAVRLIKLEEEVVFIMAMIIFVQIVRTIGLINIW